MFNLLSLHTAIAAVCPIGGVSVGSPDDKSTWRIDFADSATDAQKAAAAGVIKAFDPNAPEVPNEISDRQFFQQLAVAGIITQDDALAAVKTGTLPSALASLVGAMPKDQQFAAQMMLSGSVVFHRNHPLVSKLGVAYGWSSAQLDALWTAAASL